MIDELKPCPFCGSEYTQVRWIGFTHMSNGAFTAGYRGECCDCWATTRAFNNEADAAKVWNTRADDAPEQTVDNAQADSREQIEADAWKFVERWVVDDDDFCRPTTHLNCSKELRDLLDRQSAITRAEVFENGEYDCMTCGSKRELQQRVDSLTDERDELRGQLYTTRDVAREFRDERDEWQRTAEDYQERKDELTAERDRLQRVVKIQADSFKALEIELAKAKNG